MRQKKKVKLADLFQSEISKAEIYKNKYAQSIAEAQESDNDKRLIEKLHASSGQKGKGKYSLRTNILKNPWVLKGRPSTKAISWLFQEVFKNPQIYKYQKRIMFQGGLFIFEYKNPKYIDNLSVLPWFDKYPLVISLGPKVTNLGVRNIGFNLHLLPPKIRIIVLCKIFELHKTMYRYMIFYNKQNPVGINYGLIVQQLKRYGVKFSIRMYIPSRMNQIVNFPYRDWKNAIFIPSRGYSRIRASKLIKEWRDFCKKNGISISANIDWKVSI